jgi:hypothetical protein
LTYPQLKQDVTETKRILLEKILERHKKDTKAFETKRTQYEVPLKDYLKQQDIKVKALMDERKTTLDAITEKYLAQTRKNELLLEMKGRNVLTLSKRLNRYYQKKLHLIGEGLDSLAENYQKEKQALEEALEETFKAAQLLLEKIVPEEKKEVDLVEENYANEYQVIYEDSKTEVLEVTKVADGLNEGYKTAVNKLLATPNVEKIQMSMKEKIQQAKKDIIELEGLKLD